MMNLQHNTVRRSPRGERQGHQTVGGRSGAKSIAARGRAPIATTGGLACIICALNLTLGLALTTFDAPRTIRRGLAMTAASTTTTDVKIGHGEQIRLPESCPIGKRADHQLLH